MLFYPCNISISSYVNETSERIFRPAGSIAVAKTLASRGARAPGSVVPSLEALFAR